MDISEELNEIFSIISKKPDYIENIKIRIKMKNGANLNYIFNRKKWEKEQNRAMQPGQTESIFYGILDILGVGSAISIMVLLLVFASLNSLGKLLPVFALYGGVMILYFLSSTIFHFLDPAYPARGVFVRLNQFLQVLCISLSIFPVFFVFQSIHMPLLSLLLLFAVLALYFTGKNTSFALIAARVFSLLIIWSWLPAFGILQRALVTGRIILFMLACFSLSIWTFSLYRKNESEAVQVVNNVFLILSNVLLYFVYQTI